MTSKSTEKEKGEREEAKRWRRELGPKAYMRMIREQPCMVCECGPSEVHHFGKSGMALKCSDFLTVPLCREHHQEFHNTGRLGVFDRLTTELWFYRVQATTLAAWLEGAVLM